MYNAQRDLFSEFVRLHYSTERDRFVFPFGLGVS